MKKIAFCFALYILIRIFAPRNIYMSKMTVETWEKLSVEQKKMMVEKRKAAAKKYQGSLTILNPALL